MEILFVSIHAPTKGATSAFGDAFSAIGSFNPRSHEGSDTARDPPALIAELFQSTLPRRERQVME